MDASGLTFWRTGATIIVREVKAPIFWEHGCKRGKGRVRAVRERGGRDREGEGGVGLGFDHAAVRGQRRMGLGMAEGKDLGEKDELRYSAVALNRPDPRLLLGFIEVLRGING